MIEFKTSKGSFRVQLFDKQAPVSVENFLQATSTRATSTARSFTA